MGTVLKPVSGWLLRRRTLLKGMTAFGVLTATAPLSSCGEAEEEAPAENGSYSWSQTVYRFQTRKKNSCKACRNHKRFKVFADPLVASAHRAHPGCNCNIVPQQVTLEYLDTILPYEVNGVVELRAIYNPPVAG